MGPRASRWLSLALVVVGVLLVVRTAQYGGRGLAVGYLLGGGIALAGVARLWLLHVTGAGRGRRGGEG